MKKEPIKSMSFLQPISVAGRTISSLQDSNAGPFYAEQIDFPWIRVYLVSNPKEGRRTTIFNVRDCEDFATPEVEKDATPKK